MLGMGSGVAAPILGALVKATSVVKLESLAKVVKNSDAMYKGYDQAKVKTL
jgi:oxalate oxidoreductase subunit delta